MKPRNTGAAVFVILALIASCLPIAKSSAQQGPPSAVFTLSSANPQSPILQLNHGEGNCSVQVDVIAGGAAIIPQVTSEPGANPLSPWSTASLVGGGSINAAGTQSGPIAQSSPAGLSGFRVILSGGTGTASGKIICSTAQGPSTIASAIIVANPCPTNAQGSCVVGIAQPTDAAGRLVVTTPPPAVGLPLPTDAAGRILVTTPAPCATNAGGNSCNVSLVQPNASPEPRDSGGSLLVNPGCSQFTTAAQSATTVIANHAAHFCGIETIVTLTSTNMACYNNATTISGTILAALGTASVLGQTGLVPGGKVWATNGITCGSATGAGTVLVAWDS